MLLLLCHKCYWCCQSHHMSTAMGIMIGTLNIVTLYWNTLTFNSHHNPLQCSPNYHLCTPYTSFLPLVDQGKGTAHQQAHTGSCQDNRILPRRRRRKEEVRKSRRDVTRTWNDKGWWTDLFIAFFTSRNKCVTRLTSTSLTCLVIVVGTQATGPPNGIQKASSSCDASALAPKRSTLAWCRALRIAATS